jgi:DNA replication and repair protein RecF
VQATLKSLTLTDYRSYQRATLHAGGRTTYLFGPNGAGKTNLLEALSFFSPGRGLRAASVSEVGRRLPGEAQGRAWSVSAMVGDVQVGTGLDGVGAPRRTVRLEGETVPPGRLADLIRPMWLTPQQDRLFLEAAGERRRFFDRLAFAGEPAHALNVGSYEKAMRERNALLATENPDPLWLDALEARMAQSGSLMAKARTRTLTALQAEIDERTDRPFPQAVLSFSGGYGLADADFDPHMWREDRARDAGAGRTLRGPHRGDLEVVHRTKDRPAAECSTGEQKALILNLVLAQAARLSRVPETPNPIVLLDEVAAHLDQFRRAALFDEIEALGLQAFLTGTDQTLFDGLAGRALGVAVDDGSLAPLED